MVWVAHVLGSQGRIVHKLKEFYPLKQCPFDKRYLHTWTSVATVNPKTKEIATGLGGPCIGNAEPHPT